MPSRSSRSSRRLVIDASVAQSSGDEYATYPTSKHCRDFLLAVLEICHCAVMTAEIREEWDRHQSSFARRWRLSMVARRKLYAVDVALNDELREKIGRAASRDKDAEAMLKDTHLIEAAMATDHLVTSLDEIARALFTGTTPSVGELREIVWANPDKAEDDCIGWLRGGAKAERKRKLGFKNNQV